MFDPRIGNWASTPKIRKTMLLAPRAKPTSQHTEANFVMERRFYEELVLDIEETVRKEVGAIEQAVLHGFNPDTSHLPLSVRESIEQYRQRLFPQWAAPKSTHLNEMKIETNRILKSLEAEFMSSSLGQAFDKTQSESRSHRASKNHQVVLFIDGPNGGNIESVQLVHGQLQTALHWPSTADPRAYYVLRESPNRIWYQLYNSGKEGRNNVKA